MEQFEQQNGHYTQDSGPAGEPAQNAAPYGAPGMQNMPFQGGPQPGPGAPYGGSGMPNGPFPGGPHGGYFTGGPQGRTWAPGPLYGSVPQYPNEPMPFDPAGREKAVYWLGLLSMLAGIVVNLGNFTFAVISVDSANRIWYKITLPIWLAALAASVVGVILAYSSRKWVPVRGWRGRVWSIAGAILAGTAWLAALLGMAFHMVYFW